MFQHTKKHRPLRPPPKTFVVSIKRDQTSGHWCTLGPTFFFSFCALQNTKLAIFLHNICRTNMKCTCFIKIENMQCKLQSLKNVNNGREMTHASTEQAGFRSKYSTTDHIHAINQLKEKCREYNIPLCVAFVDYEKAFDSVQTQAILTSLQEQGIEDVHIEIMKDIYTDSSVTVHLHKESEKIRIKRGVRQGDTISPKLFTATLESIFRRLNWKNKGVKIDGEFLSNLRFADDIFLCTETPQELQHMLQELSDESRQMGLKMNITKTKVMVVDNTPINVNNVLIEHVPGYVYLGQHYSLKEKNQDKEIQRRIMAGWAAYAKHRDIFKSNLAICLKRHVYNSCVLPAMTYGAETWTLTKQAQNKLGKKYAQHHIQR